MKATQNRRPRVSRLRSSLRCGVRCRCGRVGEGIAETVGGLAFVDEVQVTVVNVDVYVRDEKGMPVNGSRVDDFSR